jgi:hypothetical protein
MTSNTSKLPTGSVRGHKFRAQRTVCSEGHSHPSKGEARRCGELHLLQRLGEIRLLQREVPFPVIINGVKVFTYKADFVYFDESGRTVEDFKGVVTPIYRLKKKCVEAYHPGLKIVEVRA